MPKKNKKSRKKKSTGIDQAPEQNKKGTVLDRVMDYLNKRIPSDAGRSNYSQEKK